MDVFSKRTHYVVVVVKPGAIQGQISIWPSHNPNLSLTVAQIAKCLCQDI